MQRVTRPLNQIFGPWPIFFDGNMYSQANTVFVVSMSQFGRRLYWKDDMFRTYEGDDQSPRFSTEAAEAAGFASAQDAKDAFELRASPYIEKNKPLFQQALLNNIRVLELDVKRQSPC